jgi:hypothetical protein
MTGKTLLRIAAVIAWVQGFAHGALIVTYVPMHGPAETTVVEAMRNSYFHFGGPWMHSYWELYFGYAMLAVLVCWMEGALLWMAGAWPNEAKRQVTWLVIAWNLVHAAVIARYFFFTPLYVDVVVIVFLVAALVKMQRPAEG